MVISMLRQKVHGHFPSSCLVSLYDLINDLFALFFSLFKLKGLQFCVRFLSYVIQTDLFDHQLVADRLDAWKSTVKLRKHRVDASGSQNCLAGVVISGMAVKHLCIVSATKLKILSYTGTSYQLKAFGSCSLGFRYCFFRSQSFLKIHKNRMLMSGDHNVDIIRINNTKTYRRHTKFRFS